MSQVFLCKICLLQGTLPDTKRIIDLASKGGTLGSSASVFTYTITGCAFSVRAGGLIGQSRLWILLFWPIEALTFTDFDHRPGFAPLAR